MKKSEDTQGAINTTKNITYNGKKRLDMFGLNHDMNGQSDRKIIL